MRVTLTRDYRKISANYEPFADAEESSDGETSDDTGETTPPLPPYDDDGYIIQIPRELVERGQRKFVVEF